MSINSGNTGVAVTEGSLIPSGSTVIQGAEKKPILTKKQILFVDTYLGNGLDAGAAFRSVYLDVSKPKSKILGAELLNKPHIQKELIRQQNEIAKSERILKSDIVSALNELKELAKQTDDRRTILRCLDMLARMANLYPQSNPLINLQNNVSASAEEIEISFNGFNPDAKDETEGDLPLGTDEISDYDFDE